MIRLLSALGRAVLVLAALLTIAAFTFGGYMGTQEYGASIDPGALPSVSRALGAVLGLVVGIIAAGAIFGPIATLYDIRDNLRRLAAPKA